MPNTPDEICGFVWEGPKGADSQIPQKNCCYRNTLAHSEHCAWHADDKSGEDLADCQANEEVMEQTRFVNELLDGAKLTRIDLPDEISLNQVSLRGAEMRGINLAGKNLQGTDLSYANMRSSSFNKAHLSQCNLRGADLTSAELSGANLSNTDLSKADLENAELTDAQIRNGDLSDSNLQYATLTGVYLTNGNLAGSKLDYADLDDAVLAESDLSDSNLNWVDLSGADLGEAQLRNATLQSADLAGANLRGADISYADLRESSIEDVTVNSDTECERLGYGFENEVFDSRLPRWIRHWRYDSEFDADDWEKAARVCNDIKMAFADTGVVNKARDMHVDERRIRGFQAKSENGRRSPQYLGSLFSSLITGYGVRVRKLVFWMIFLFVVSTAIYISSGVRPTLIENISYSVLAFTVAPPSVPTGVGTQIVMMIETFFGTLSTVLLGYILGNREQF